MLKIQRFLFAQRNRIFAALSMLFVLMLLLAIKYCDAPLLLPEKWFGFFLCDPDGDKTWYDIAIGYISAYVFYIVQVYIPTASAERRAWLIVQPKLSACVRDWKEYIILLKTLLIFEENGNAEPTEKSFRYYKVYNDCNRPGGKKEPSQEDKSKKQRTPDSCFGTEGLIKKANEMGERSQKLMELQAVGMLDPNLMSLLFETAPVAFFQGAASNLNVIGKLNSLRASLAEANAESVKNEILKNNELPDGISVIRRGDKVYIHSWDGSECNVPFSNCEKMPLHTSLPEDVARMEANINKLERYCDLNSQITITEMTDEERERTDKNNALYHPAIAKAMRQ